MKPNRIDATLTLTSGTPDRFLLPASLETLGGMLQYALANYDDLGLIQAVELDPVYTPTSIEYAIAKNESERKEWNRYRRTIKRKFEQLREDPEYRYAHPSHAAAAALDWFSLKYGIGYGSAGYAFDCQNGVEYLNTGDTYSTTVLYDGNRWQVTTYGDYIETYERKHGVKV